MIFKVFSRLTMTAFDFFKHFEASVGLLRNSFEKLQGVLASFQKSHANSFNVSALDGCQVFLQGLDKRRNAGNFDVAVISSPENMWIT
jgi:hypothetical protein